MLGGAGPETLEQMLIVGGMFAGIVGATFTHFCAMTLAYEGTTNSVKDSYSYFAKLIFTVDLRDWGKYHRELVEKYPSLEKHFYKYSL